MKNHLTLKVAINKQAADEILIWNDTLLMILVQVKDAILT